MNTQRIMNGFRSRLPGNFMFSILIKSIKLYISDRECSFYKNQIMLNIRAYFRLKNRYGPLLYKKADISDFDVCYHVTERDNAASIMKYGIKNDKTNIVFFALKSRSILNFTKHRKFKDPIVLCVDVKNMSEKGYEFYTDELNGWFTAAESIPPQFITADNDFFLRNNAAVCI